MGGSAGGVGGRLFRRYDVDVVDEARDATEPMTSANTAVPLLGGPEREPIASSNGGVPLTLGVLGFFSGVGGGGGFLTAGDRSTKTSAGGGGGNTDVSSSADAEFADVRGDFSFSGGGGGRCFFAVLRTEDAADDGA